MLRNNSDMPKTLKNKMVSGNPRPYSTYLHTYIIHNTCIPTRKYTRYHSTLPLTANHSPINCYWTAFTQISEQAHHHQLPVLVMSLPYPYWHYIALYIFRDILLSWCERAAVSRILYVYSSKVTADPPDGRHNLEHVDGLLKFCKRYFPVSPFPTNCNVIRNDGRRSPAKKFKVVSKISKIQFAPNPSIFRLGQLTLKSFSWRQENCK